MIYRYILDLIDDGLIRGGKALDLGCGPGAASTLLASLGFKVKAVDKEYQDIPSANGCIPVVFTKSDIRSFAIAEGSYDFIHARHVLHFLNKDDIRATIRRMYRGLKKGGVLYFTLSGDKDGWRDKSKGITFLTDDELEEYVENEISDDTHHIYNKTIRLGYGTTTKGIRKFTHTISYTAVR